ncbi:MAG: acyltransferase [Mesorhizobium sp.]|nr:MAG: acyltransferase [Mesorhizobium sp.]TIV56822.1 MAG: acyltransferase [Mesorhizobium sp.]
MQYLRGLAACAVVCFHIREQFGGPFDVGAAGVDVFFVISGFIMWVTTAGRPTNPWRFMGRRITRIVPLYWIVTLLTAMGILMKPQFFYDHFFSVANFVGSLFFLPILQEDALHPIVVQGWTLCYEMMFYLVFTLVLLLGERWRFGILVGALAAIVALHFVLPAGYARAFTDPVVIEFAAGVVVGRLWLQGARLPLGAGLAMSGAGILLLTAGQWFDAHLPRALLWGLPAALIVAGAVFAERARPFKPDALPTFLGDASYSIYLWHIVVGVLATGVVLRIGIPAALQPVTIIVATLALSAMLYLIVEKPLIALLHPQRPKAAVKARSAAAAGAAE